MEKKKLSFEEKLMRLEEIVAASEQGKLPLEETLRLHEEGEKLIKELRGELAAAGGSLCVGTVLYDEALRRIAVTEECCEPIGAVGNVLFSHEAVIDPATGRPEGLLWREVLSVSVGTDYACMLDVSGVLTVLATSGEDIAQCLRHHCRNLIIIIPDNHAFFRNHDWSL